LNAPASPADRVMKILANSSNIYASLTASLFIHFVAFGVIASVQSKVRPFVIREPLPVELVQLPATLRYERRASVAVRPREAPRPLETPAQVVPRERPVPPPQAVTQKAAPLPQPGIEAPAAGSSHISGGAALPGGAAAVKDYSPAAGTTVAPPRVTTGAPQPQKRDKGSYQAFYRLTRLPSFRVRTEPVYPDPERMTGSEARVLAEIYLDEQGTVDDVTIRKSGGKLFDRAVIDAARQSSFHPGYMGEKAVPTVIQIPYQFKLK
jgi:protein TonB